LSKANIAIFISGRGSNMVSLIEAMQANEVDAIPVVVISDQSDAKGITRAQTLGVPCEIVSQNNFSNKELFERHIITLLRRYHVDWIALAGYMVIVGQELLAAYPDRIINIHPSLLPTFKGLNAQQQALDYGVKYSGCTVHYVTANVDGGKIINQCVVEVKPNDTVDSLSARILIKEHELYPRALQKVILKTKGEK
tara:strand:- start:1650 stop:2237 length:588 start_codon:yes stop_codon:yes gene_type:complete